MARSFACRARVAFDFSFRGEVGTSQETSK
jgi:hypothetical protein